MGTPVSSQTLFQVTFLCIDLNGKTDFLIELLECQVQQIFEVCWFCKPPPPHPTLNYFIDEIQK